MSKENIIDIGAEAILIKKDGNLIKRRVKKRYRHNKIDEILRKKRTRLEARNIERISQDINVPKIIEVDEENKEITMEFIKGGRLSEVLNKFSLKKQERIIKEISGAISKMHNKNIIHGDLTTSNMILEENIYFIDFGLSFHSLKEEDKAVDLHLLKQALEAKHFKTWEKLWGIFIENYRPEKKKSILDRLEKVEGRGRYK